MHVANYLICHTTLMIILLTFYPSALICTISKEVTVNEDLHGVGNFEFKP